MHLYTLTHTQVKWNGTTMGESESVWKRNKETEWGKKKREQQNKTVTKALSTTRTNNIETEIHWNWMINAFPWIIYHSHTMMSWGYKIQCWEKRAEKKKKLYTRKYWKHSLKHTHSHHQRAAHHIHKINECKRKREKNHNIFFMRIWWFVGNLFVIRTFQENRVFSIPIFLSLSLLSVWFVLLLLCFTVIAHFACKTNAQNFRSAEERDGEREWDIFFGYIFGACFNLYIFISHIFVGDSFSWSVCPSYFASHFLIVRVSLSSLRYISLYQFRLWFTQFFVIRFFFRPLDFFLFWLYIFGSCKHFHLLPVIGVILYALTTFEFYFHFHFHC